MVKIPRPSLAAALVAVGFCALALGAFAASGSNPRSIAGTTAQAATQIKLGVISSGYKNDSGYAGAIYQGVLVAEKRNPNLKLTSFVENISASAAPQTLRDLSLNNDVVYAGSRSYTSAVQTIAPQNPHVFYILTGPALPQLIPNVVSLDAWSQLATIPAGMAMATLSKSGKIGLINGVSTPQVQQIVDGLQFGARKVNPKIRVFSVITGDYEDVAKASAAAKAMIANGVDEILTVLDVGNQGVFQAARQAGRVGVLQFTFSQQETNYFCKTAPALVGAVFQDNTTIAENALADYAAGRLKAGAVIYTARTPSVVRFSLCKGKGTPQARKVAAQGASELAKGKLKYPANLLNALPPYKVVQK